MKTTLDKERVKLFLKIGLAYLTLWLLSDLFGNTETFLKRAWNNIWLVAYLTTLNFLFYEYALPYLRLNLKRIFIGFFLLFGFLMLYSFGFYAWRNIGVGLNLYFPLREHVSISKGVEY